MEIFIELSYIVIVVTLVSFLMRVLRQPLVVGYILAGVLVGPYFLDILHSTEYIEVFSKIGITTLLFIVGLSLNPAVVREVGKASSTIGLGQIAVTGIISFFICQALGLNVVSSLYISVALTFSSTIIILKLLSDKGDLGKLYGKILIGSLIIEDIVASLILMIVSATALSQNESVVILIIGLMIKGVAAVILLYLISKYALPKFGRFFASSQEMLFLFSLAWGIGMAALFYKLGFSLEIGALIAGVTLSVSPFAYEIGSRIRPLRDFFVTLFFVLLGSQLVLENAEGLFASAIILSLFILLIKPFIVVILMNLMGYSRSSGFLAGLTVAQISEFSLILVALGYSLGHVPQSAVSLITLVGIITIGASTYLIMYADVIYRRTEWLVKLFEIRKKHKRGSLGRTEKYDMVIFGYDRVGIDFVDAAEKIDKSYLVVDFNPDSIKKLQAQGIPFKYGDAEDVEFLQELGFEHTELVVSTLPDFKSNMLILSAYRHVNPTGVVMVLSHDIDHARKLYLAGASYVIMPHYLGARHAALMIARHGTDPLEFERERNLHLSKLEKRVTT